MGPGHEVRSGPKTGNTLIEQKIFCVDPKSQRGAFMSTRVVRTAVQNAASVAVS